MRAKILKSLNWFAIVILLAADVLFTAVMYQQSFNHMKETVQENMAYMKQTVEEYGMDYLNDIPRGNENFRITWIDASGTVLYDSMESVEYMENHAGREEVQKAQKKGKGEAYRYSNSIGEQTYYYAVRLSDQSILRISSTSKSIFVAIMNATPWLIMLIVIVFIVSLFVARMQAKRLVSPINHIDLDHPLDNEIYEELSPLLMRLENQNRKIKYQIDRERKQQWEFQAVTKNMKEGLMILNKEETILMINEAFLSIFECGEGSYIGEHLLVVSRARELMDAAQSALKGNTKENTIALDGKCYQILANPVFENNSQEEITGAVILVMDITEAAMAQQRRQEFVANVSHELKTPLMSISGYAEIIHDGIAKPEDIPKFSGRIFQEAKRLTTLVEDIIRLSEFDDAQMEHVTEEVDLKELSEQVISYVNEEAAKKNISISIEGETIKIRGVRKILEEMVFNLCDNAIKYNVEGGSVKISLGQQNQQKILSVSDTGIGIPKKSQDRVFERFYRVDKSHSRSSGGTGLGLSIVKHGAILHNAAISLESEPDKGTTIKIIFQE